jgi:hypothetical protein
VSVITTSALLLSAEERVALQLRVRQEPVTVRRVRDHESKAVVGEVVVLLGVGTGVTTCVGVGVGATAGALTVNVVVVVAAPPGPLMATTNVCVPTLKLVRAAEVEPQATATPSRVQVVAYTRPLVVKAIVAEVLVEVDGAEVMVTAGAAAGVTAFTAAPALRTPPLTERLASALTGVTVASKSAFSCALVRLGLAESMSASVAETMGVAIEVPLS